MIPELRRLGDRMFVILPDLTGHRQNVILDPEAVVAVGPAPGPNGETLVATQAAVFTVGPNVDVWAALDYAMAQRAAICITPPRYVTDGDELCRVCSSPRILHDGNSDDIHHPFESFSSPRSAM